MILTTEEYNTLSQLRAADHGMLIEEFDKRNSERLLENGLVLLYGERVFMSLNGFETLFKEEHSI